MKRAAWRVALALVLCILIGLLAWGYSYNSPMVPRASREWSRGRVLGRTSVSRPIVVQPLPDATVLLVWPNLESRLELAHIGSDGTILLARTLPLDTTEPRDPQLQIGADGRLHLLWREVTEPHATIHYALLEADGTLLNNEPLVLSDPTRWAEDEPRLALAPDGRLHAMWADEEGLQWAVLDLGGNLVSPPTLLVPNGRSPAVQVDDGGQLHVAWQEWSGRNTRRLYYAILDPASGELNDTEEIAQVFRRTGQRVEGPALGLDEETGYVLWTMVDMREVSSRGEYAFFPLGLPRQKRLKNLHLAEGWDPSGITVLEGQVTPLLLALSETVESRWTPSGVAQISVMALAQDQTPEYEIWGCSPVMPWGRRALGAPAERQSLNFPPRQTRADGWEAEHIITASTLPSVRPTLAMDGNGYFHLAWLEPGGFGQYRVVYASTAPGVQQTYNAFTLWDVVNPLFTSVFRLSLVVLVLGPMLVLWMMLPLGGLLIYHLVTGEEWMDTRCTQLVLVAALALETALTFFFPLPSGGGWPPLRWVAPAAATLIAGLATWRYLRHPEDRSLFPAFFLFTAIQGLMQLAVHFLV